MSDSITREEMVVRVGLDLLPKVPIIFKREVVKYIPIVVDYLFDNFILIPKDE